MTFVFPFFTLIQIHGNCSCKPNVIGKKCDICTAGLFDVQKGCLGKTSILITNSTDSNSDKSVTWWFLCKLCNRSLTFYLAVIGIIFKLKGFKAFQVIGTTKFHRDAWGWNCMWEECNNWNRLHTLFLLNDGLKFSHRYISIYIIFFVISSN